ncbi:MAG TPA: hypothetical protein VII55_01465 [Candidatus Saccharimonadales bacterium]
MILKLYNDRLFKSGSRQDTKPGTVDSQATQRLYELDDQYEKQEIKLARVVRYKKRQAGQARL